MTNAERIWRNWNSNSVLVTLENVLAVPQNKLNRVTTKSQNSIPRYIPKTNKNIRSHKNLYTNGTLLRNSQNEQKRLKYPSADEWINNTCNEVTLSNKKK